MGQKFEASSYEDIALTIGIDDASSVVFATDVLREAQAAKRAGWCPVIVVRPGNPPINEQHDFTVARTLMDIIDLDL